MKLICPSYSFKLHWFTIQFSPFNLDYKFLSFAIIRPWINLTISTVTKRLIGTKWEISYIHIGILKKKFHKIFYSKLSFSSKYPCKLSLFLYCQNTCKKEEKQHISTRTPKIIMICLFIAFSTIEYLCFPDKEFNMILVSCPV